MLARLAKLETAVHEQQSYLQKQDEVLDNIWALLTDSQVTPSSHSSSSSSSSPDVVIAHPQSEIIPVSQKTGAEPKQIHKESSSVQSAVTSAPSTLDGGKRKIRSPSPPAAPSPPLPQSQIQPPTDSEFLDSAPVLKKARTEATHTAATELTLNEKQIMDKPVVSEGRKPSAAEDVTSTVTSASSKHDSGHAITSLDKSQDEASARKNSDSQLLRSPGSARYRSADRQENRHSHSRSHSNSHRHDSYQGSPRGGSSTSPRSNSRSSPRSNSRSSPRGRSHERCSPKSSPRGRSHERSGPRSPRGSGARRRSPPPKVENQSHWDDYPDEDHHSDHYNHNHNGSRGENSHDHNSYKHDPRVSWCYPQRDSHSGWRSSSMNSNHSEKLSSRSHTSTSSTRKNSHNERSNRRVIVESRPAKATSSRHVSPRGGVDKHYSTTSSASTKTGGTKTVVRPSKKYFNVHDDESTSHTSTSPTKTVLPAANAVSAVSRGVGQHRRFDSGGSSARSTAGRDQWWGSTSAVPSPAPVHRKCFCGWCAHCTGAVVK